MTLTQERLKQLLHYDPETGVMTWIASTNRRIRTGAIAGWRNGKYEQVRIDGTLYQSHRIIWIWMTGTFPPEDVDHINGNKHDNRWDNLRAASRSQNNANTGPHKSNKSGLKGVSWHAPAGMWVAQISINNRTRSLGTFKTKEAAHAAYVKAQLRRSGEFARTSW